MELWIRSQSKKNLMKANDIVAEYNKIVVYKEDDDSSTTVGEYESKKRALEVLDDIQCHLVNINDSRDSYFYVYEIPKE